LFMIALAILALKMFPIFSVLLIAPVIVATINVIYSSCPWIPDPAKPAELTYGMYLIHMPIMQVIFIIVRILNVKPSIYFHPFLLIAYITFVLILSRMSFSYFENPIRYRIRKLFSIASPV
jgi:peptidoglycan/LPS O-acetylase OafA/YrhL